MRESASIEERVRALSPEKRALLALRLRDAPHAGQAATSSRVRLVAFVTRAAVEADGFESEEDELRDHLRRELPEHMIPSSYHVLDAFPVLPNGKVDVRALEEVTGDAEAATEEWVEPRDSTERLLAEIWCEVLQTDSISVHDNFFELGGDSILSVHVVSRANQQGLSLSPNDLFNFPTVAQLGERVRNKCQEATDQPADKLAPGGGWSPHPTNRDASSPGSDDTPSPFVMVHGVATMVSLIQSHLDAGQRLYTFSAHWERADLERHATVEDMAEEYVEELLTLQPSGPYFLGGYSMGAPIALEMARSLERRGEEVGLLFLLDPPGRVRGQFAPIPGDEGRRDSAPDTATARRQGAVAYHIRNIRARGAGDAFRYILDEAREQFRYRVLRPSRVRFRNRILRPASLAVARLCHRWGLPLPLPFRRSYVRSVYTDAWRRYELKPFSGRIVIFRASMNPFAEDRGMWEDIAGGELKVEWFEARHFDFYTDTDTMNLWASRLAALLASYRAQLTQVDSQQAKDESGSELQTPYVAGI